jgi:hypothetical protein
MRTVTIKREKNFLGKWLDYYVVADIPQNELVEYTGVKKYALGFAEGLVKSSREIFIVKNAEIIRFDLPESTKFLYAVYFDSSGIRFGEEFKLDSGAGDLNLSLKTKVGLSSNKLIFSKR